MARVEQKLFCVLFSSFVDYSDAFIFRSMRAFNSHQDYANVSYKVRIENSS